jgi:BioD-like phosphotransacetylase family protein
MRSIFIGSTGGEPGQTLVTWALATRLRDRGLRVGFFKPYGLLPDVSSTTAGGLCDADVLLLQKVLELEEGEELLCPVTLTQNLVSELQSDQAAPLLEKIQGAFRKVSEDKDVVLILGAKEIFFGGGHSNLSDSILVKLFDASVLLVDRYQRDNMTFYSLLSLNSFLDGRVKSAVLNHVPVDKMDHVRTKVIPFLQAKTLKSALAVPEDPVLAAQTVSTLTALVEGEILCCPEAGTNLVETSTIGSKHLEGSLAVFKQVYNKILLVGFGQGEKQKTIAGIILTGGKAPSELVRRVARERNVPLILTRQDTFQAVEKLEKAKPALEWKDRFKVQRFLDLIGKEPGAEGWVDALL